MINQPYQPICDWMSWRHDYPVGSPAPVLEAGKILRITADGEVEWETGTWADVRSPSSDTAVRVKCDGQHLHFSGNPGRFGNRDNVTGVGVLAAFERSVEIVSRVFPQLRLGLVGTVAGEGTAAESGTRLTRIDLAGNFETDAYASLVSVVSSRRIGQRLPMAGKYGPVWGYDTKRGQWVKAKLYDKTAEVEGRRVVSTGATLARFEVQLGSEFLRQKSLSRLKHWDSEMGKIVYGNFLAQVLREQVSIEDWSDIPAKLRATAVLWRDGVPPRSLFKSKSGYYNARAKLLEFGIDIGVPCNVMALTRQVRVVEVRPVDALRRAA